MRSALVRGSLLQLRARSLRFAWPALLGAAAGVVLLALHHSGSTVPSAFGPPDAPEPHELPSVWLVPSLVANAEPANAHRSFARLPLVPFLNLNNHDQAIVRLYDHRGRVRPEAMTKLRRLLADVRKPDDLRTKPIHPRLAQLLFRAAYHFRARRVVIVSGFREARGAHEGFHAEGMAVDFWVEGVRLGDLVDYLRTFPKAGVGVYLSPSTQFVHLDCRDDSFQWVDDSAAGEPKLPRAIGNLVRLRRRDATYKRQDDWPEDVTMPRARAIP